MARATVTPVFGPAEVIEIDDFDLDKSGALVLDLDDTGMDGHVVIFAPGQWARAEVVE